MLDRMTFPVTDIALAKAFHQAALATGRRDRGVMVEASTGSHRRLGDRLVQIAHQHQRCRAVIGV